MKPTQAKIKMTAYSGIEQGEFVRTVMGKAITSGQCGMCSINSELIRLQQKMKIYRRALSP